MTDETPNGPNINALPRIHAFEDFFASLPELISYGGPLQIILHVANLGVSLYVLVWCVLAWRRYAKLPSAVTLVSLALIPLFLSTAVALLHLSDFLTIGRYHELVSRGSIKGEFADSVGSVLLAIGCIRLSLCSGLIFSSLILIAFCATRKLKAA